ncbi:MAG: tryptophan synthase subunit alpha [Firmicutes bacterium]|nr:tryptophan synthase subunit alpha [Bacillota bacterium]
MLEISLPLIENKEAPYLSELMVQAYCACPDYDVYLAGIRRIAEKYPDVPITLLLYNEVALRIGPEKLAEFCRENGIRDVNSADLSDKNAIDQLRAHGVRIAGLVRANFTDESVACAKSTDGFVYMTAFAPAEKCRPGFETIKSRIAYVRQAGVCRPIYCGGGVRSPQDAVTVRDAGADGVFLGTSILKLQGNAELLIRTVREYRSAIDG